MACLTLVDLIRCLDDPVAEGLGRDESGYYAFVDTKAGLYHRSIGAAAQRRGYKVERGSGAGAGLFRIYATQWHARPAQRVLCSQDDPARITVEVPGGWRSERDTRPDQMRLSPLACWVFDHAPAGVEVKCYDQRGAFLRGYAHRPIVLGERELDYWNGYGRAFGDEAVLLRVGDAVFPHPDFRDQTTQEGFEIELRMEGLATGISAIDPRYHW